MRNNETYEKGDQHPLSNQKIVYILNVDMTIPYKIGVSLRPIGMEMYRYYHCCDKDYGIKFVEL